MQLRTAVRPAPDRPGQWIAHCLDVDVVTQGNSRAHAIAMAIEAVAMVIADEHAAGRDPAQRRAPPEICAEYDGDELVDIGPAVGADRNLSC